MTGLGLRYQDLAATMPCTAVAVLVRSAIIAQLDWLGPQDEHGNTHLHLAAARPGDNGALCSALVAAGVPVDAVNKEGDTALFIAARGAAPCACRALIAAGTDVLVRNTRNRTAGTQIKLDPAVREYLFEEEEAARAARAGRNKQLWDGKLAATQTASACALRSV
ncbi:hypothetical protein MNEG_3934 [Monoraphidium neglectum]|uniref:Uncharacterized protein n=1 Tax=Monoraphidium neglectum TaxID=145388 RepID=A0A0D2NG21_9CHLO|nr:hypothetical protein MNEG_3934 [Monoraphidium neglectum]KIZ04021.1 hypothetical protein MNEG_3934 [Monoraphidium neglectum]|eukprot:XP_013903040.1 hypothetical protein MNEG_3934 [Monoraphidium neglectum]